MPFDQNNSSPGAAPLPPLPVLSGKGGQGDTSTPQGAAPGGMASMISGLMPVQQGVKAILIGCQMIQQSGAIPGSEQLLGQIIALSNSLLPMAAQAMVQPGGGGVPSGAAPQGGIPPVGGM